MLISQIDKEVSLLLWQKIKERPIRFAQTSLTAIVMCIAIKMVCYKFPELFGEVISMTSLILSCGLFVSAYWALFIERSQGSVLSQFQVATWAWLTPRNLLPLVGIFTLLGFVFAAATGDISSVFKIKDDFYTLRFLHVTPELLVIYMPLSMLTTFSATYCFFTFGVKAFLVVRGVQHSLFSISNIELVMLRKGYVFTLVKLNILATIVLSLIPLAFGKFYSMGFEMYPVTTALILTGCIAHITGERPKKKEKVKSTSKRLAFEC